MFLSGLTDAVVPVGVYPVSLVAVALVHRVMEVEAAVLAGSPIFALT